MSADLLRGVGPEAPIDQAHGGLQSLKRWRFDLLDGPALFVLGRILDYGATKYGPHQWRQITVASHLNAVLMHTLAYLAGDRRDDHLGHLFCRAMMALATALDEGYVARQADEAADD